MDILRDLTEVRETASLLNDLLYDIENVNILSALSQTMIDEINAGARLLRGQIVLLVTRTADGVVVASIPAVVIAVEKYTNSDPANVTYKLVSILGKIDTPDDVSSVIALNGASVVESVDVNVSDAIVELIKVNTIGGSALEFKKMLGVRHLLYINNNDFNSFF